MMGADGGIIDDNVGIAGKPADAQSGVGLPAQPSQFGRLANEHDGRVAHSWTLVPLRLPSWRGVQEGTAGCAKSVHGNVTLHSAVGRWHPLRKNSTRISGRSVGLKEFFGQSGIMGKQ